MRNNKVICAIAVLLFLIQGFAQTASAQQFNLKGEISGQDSGKLMLTYQNKYGKRVTDTCFIKKGDFAFKGEITEPTIAYFYGAIKSYSVDDPNTTTLFLEPTEMHMLIKADDFKNAVITGSKTEDERVELERQKAPVNLEMQPLDTAFAHAAKNVRVAIKNNADEKTIKELREKAGDIHDQFDPYFKRLAVIDAGYFTAHPNSYLTAYRLLFDLGSISLDSIQMFYSRMNPSLQQSTYGKELAEQIEKMHLGMPGSMAADFSTNDVNGKPLTLSAFKGKYVILDFWASWCVPCRHSNPHMIALYNKYHSKGLDIIGIASDDDRPQDWRKAIAQDNVGIWHNVLDGLDRTAKSDKEIGQKFGIHSLPTKIIIDPNGKIIGRYGDNLGGTEADMDNLLTSVLN
jgi:thiol-disulfide isomerase/thioredoxin